MEEILKELKEVKKLLQAIISNLEQREKGCELDVDQVAKMMAGLDVKPLEHITGKVERSKRFE